MLVRCDGCEKFGSVNLVRYHDVFAPNSSYRATLTPARRGRKTNVFPDDRTPAQRRAAMTWAQRLKRVFNIDIETCEAGGGTVKIIAGIEDRAAIQRIPSLSPLLAENRRTLSTRCLKHLDVCFREDCRPNL